MHDAARLVAVVDATLRESRAGAPGAPPVSPDSLLDSDLGFDSLSRTELLLRIERAFAVRLPEDTLQRAETVADLLDALRRAAPVAPQHVGTGPVVPTPARQARPDAPAAAGDDPMARATTLLDLLAVHLRSHPDRRHITCLVDDTEDVVSFAQLDAQAAVLAGGLQHAGVRPRECVAIMLPTSREYFASYLGILRAGAVPVPIYPPARASQLEEHVLRHAGILANAGAVLLLTVPEAMVVARLLRARVPGLRRLATPAQLAAPGRLPVAVPAQAQDIAFIQYTSGSTGSPKGVALTHANLLANIRAMKQAVQATPDDVFVSWLPLYHDMGLIGAWLGALYVGYALVVMSPLAFLARPERWLQALHRYRGTLSAAPNFAYELCVKRIDEAHSAALDLGSWRIAFNGAEAVSPDTLQRFERRFARCGLRPGTLLPVYGLAEAGLGLLFPPLGQPARVDRIERDAFARERRAVPAADDDPAALRFVGCGAPLPGHEVRLVDEGGRELGERVEGRLEFRGPSATAGYYRNPVQTARLFDAGWLDTGDRAYRAEGQVFVTGRVKDIVIRGGRNLYPQEIETAVGAVPGVRQGCVAAFGAADPGSGTERLVVLAETRYRDAPAQARLREAVSRAVVQAIGEPPDEVLLVAPHSVLKTSSGKLRRSACRQRYEDGSLGAVAPAAGRQLLRLAAGAAALRLGEAAHGLARGLFGAAAALLFWALAALAWPLVAASGDPARAWRICHRLARLLLRLTATPLAVKGLEVLPCGPSVLVCNHGSYLDGVLLLAALPRPCSIVAKRELQRSAALRRFLQRLGAEFVDRFDAVQGVADARRLSDLVAQGRSLLFFPEGTFVAGPGLLPFHLGAFMVAVDAQVPVVPVALHGTRAMLPDGRWWPRPGRLAVAVGAPIVPTPAGGDFGAALALRDAAQCAIARALDDG